MSQQFVPPTVLEALAHLGIALDSEQRERLETLGEMLVSANARVNLTAITEPAEVGVKHVLDSLTVLPVIRERLGDEPARLVDVGAGAGFPGLPLAIALPALDVALVEATGKKAAFIERAIAELGLSNARAVRGRAEEVGQEAAYRGRARFAAARAVGRVATLAELTLPLLEIGGWALLWKTRAGAADEVPEARRALTMLGGSLEDIADVSVPELLDGRVCVVLRKIRETPREYPRRPGMPRHRPLGVTTDS